MTKPMDDDVLELTRKCAEAMGLNPTIQPNPWGADYAVFMATGHYYDPASDPAQAFELLCWLAKRGAITGPYGFSFIPFHAAPAMYEICKNPAELRLAIMRAVCKVKEG